MTARRVQKPHRGFTMLELVVVLLLLAVVAAFAAPRLSGFLSGRNVQEEGRRMISVTRYAQAQSVNLGLRMQVWFDPKTSTYGVRSDQSDGTDGFTPIQFTCQEGLTLDIDPKALDANGQAEILFWPDGSIDPNSIDRVELWEKGQPSMALERIETGLDYTLENIQNERKS